MELRHQNFKGALELMRRATAKPSVEVKRRGDSNPSSFNVSFLLLLYISCFVVIERAGNCFCAYIFLLWVYLSLLGI